MDGVPKLYQTAAESFGFLVLSGGEMLVPLDGQHRLVALQAALSDNDEKQNEIQEVAPNPELTNDDVVLIMIRHDTQKSRKIFNKVKEELEEQAAPIEATTPFCNDVIGVRG